MQIYIVTAGYYSDFCIKGVFTDEALAEEFRSLYDYDDVMEYTANELPSNWTRVLGGERLHTVYMERNGDVRASSRDASGQEGTFLYAPNNVLVVRRWADDLQRVVKIANEMRAQKIASGEWE